MAKNTRYAWADYLKFICIIAVIITHNPWSLEQRIMFGFNFHIDMAVPIFMILSGYFSTYTYVKLGLDKYYSSQNITKKLFRYILPYVVIFVLEMIAYFHSGQSQSLIMIRNNFLSGSSGPGGYYIPIMFQFVFMVPIIIEIIKRKKTKGLVICAIINFVYEILVQAYSVSAETYRLIVFRYILLIACGAWFYFYTNKEISCKKIHLKSTISIIIGVVYIYLITYTNYIPKMFIYWKQTSMMIAFWVFPLFLLFYTVAKKLPNSKLQIFGAASYHIFLFQMFYFLYAKSRLLRYINISSFLGIILMDIAVCVLCGTIFYFIETKFEKKSLNLIFKLSNKYKHNNFNKNNL